MAGAASGKGGVADATLNVVPFIDLLICLICFLVISAAWSTLSKIDVDQALPKASKSPPKNDDKKKDPKLNVAVTPNGYMINLWNAENVALQQPETIPTTGEFRLCRGKMLEGTCQGSYENFKKYDKAKLQERLAYLMKEAKKGDKLKTMVACHDKVPYIHLIGTLDTVLHSCEDEEGTSCLKSPSVGDINLLRAEGFQNFE